MLKIPKVILIIERSRAFGRGLLQGIMHYSNLHKPWLFYMEPEFYKKGKEKSYKWMKNLNADGIIRWGKAIGIGHPIVDQSSAYIANGRFY